MKILHKVSSIGVGAACLIGMTVGVGTAMAEWKPTKSVEFIVPAGTGGGADQMARMIQGIIQKHNLMEQPLVVINKGGGAGAEGFLDVKGAANDPHKIIITLSNLFTTPLATGIPFNWKDLTPVKMMALDEFVLWVPADAKESSAKEYLESAKSAGSGGYKMGGTGSKQEDQIVTIAVEKAAGTKIAYVPYKGGGEVATQLVGKHVNSSVNNPIEAVSQWKAGNLKPLCVFDEQRMSYSDKVTETMAWSDIPTCKEFRDRFLLSDAPRHLHRARHSQGCSRILHRGARQGAGHAGMEGLHGQGSLQHHEPVGPGIRRMAWQD